MPDNAAQPFGPSWQALIDQPDRAAALGCFRAATLMSLEASAAEPLGVGRSQPVVPGPGGQADPAQALAARPGPLHSRPQPAGQFGEISSAPGGGAERRACRIGRGGRGRRGRDRGWRIAVAAPQAGTKGSPSRTGAPGARARLWRCPVPGSSGRSRRLDAVLVDPPGPPGPVGAGTGDALRRSHGARLRSFRRRPGAHGAGIGGRQPRADDAEDRGGAAAPLGK